MPSKYNSRTISHKPRGKDGRFIKVRKSTKKKSTKKRSTKKKTTKGKSTKKKCKYGKRQDGYCKTKKSTKKKCKYGKGQDGYCKTNKSTKIKKIKKSTKKRMRPTFNARITGYVKDLGCRQYKFVRGCQSDPNCMIQNNKCLAKTNVKGGRAVYEGPSFMP
jgi:hypothetical protein